MELLLQHKRIWVQGLLIQCPAGKALDSCPAKDIRKLDIVKRLELVETFSESDLDDILMKHQYCISHRLNPFPEQQAE